CKPHRMMLIQGDIKYGLKLPIGKNGAMVQTYLSSAIDDHSRYVLQSFFYDNQEEAIVEDTFRKVKLKHGKFDACYFDHGSQYVAKQLKFSLSRLGITIRTAPVRSGKSKGKIEKFHQVVDSFLREAKAHKIRTLEELNHYWEIYLEEYYHKTPHDGIREYYESMNSPVPAAASHHCRNGEGIQAPWHSSIHLLLLRHSCIMKNVLWTRVPASAFGAGNTKQSLR
ncbi:MAG: DDE-type integrase/transposase/recombinase, partial [Lachnospiraceae bacterium]|nr:DDE-type integrase/transposase/recombinase [Lachnospiraceae bacterium]